jgi:hypothetical protein
MTLSIRRRHAAALALAAAASLPAQAAQYEGQEFPDTLQLSGATLQLNGVGAKVFVMRYSAYLGALYLPHKAGTPDAIYAQAGPKRMELRNCSEAEQAAVAERVKQFNATIGEVGRVKKGDVLAIDYLPAQGGTVLSVNGKVWGKPIEGQDFYTAFLKVFIGDHSSDARLRTRLLGQPG